MRITEYKNTQPAMGALEIWTSCSHWGMFFEREASFEDIVWVGTLAVRKTWDVRVNA